MTSKAYVGAGIRDIDKAKKDLLERLRMNDTDLYAKANEWLVAYEVEEWALACNAAEAPIGGTGRLPKSLLHELRDELLLLAWEHLGFEEGSVRDAKRFDFEAGIAMRKVVGRHMPVEQFAYTASSWKFWALISVYLLPDIVRWRWDKKHEPQKGFYTEGEEVESSLRDNALSRFGLARQGTLVRDTFARIWWKTEMLDPSAGGVGIANYSMPDAKWQERPSIFNRRRTAEHVGNVTSAASGSSALPHGGHEQWAKAYGGAFPSFDPDFVDLYKLDQSRTAKPYSTGPTHDEQGEHADAAKLEGSIALTRWGTTDADRIADEPISKSLGVKNSGGFRWSGKSESTLIVALYIHPENHGGWVEKVIPGDETLLYNGDARKGKPYHEAPGNRILMRLDGHLETREQRSKSPVFFVFDEDKSSTYGRRFVGVAAPDASGSNAWLEHTRYKYEGAEHVNLRARFRLLDIDNVTHKWLDDLKGGKSLTENTPEAWRRWVELGHP